MRPTMRTVAVKTSEQQARAMLFRTRDLLVGQRTQMVNALRGHLAEHGIIVGKGLGNWRRSSRRTICLSWYGPWDVSISVRSLSYTKRLIRSIVVSRRRRNKAISFDGCRKCLGSGRSARWQPQPSRRLWRHSEVVAILQPGLALSRDNTRAEARKSSAVPRRWVNEISEGF